MTEINARIADLINFSSNQKPLEFGATFNEILRNKVTAAIDTRKTEIASRMFNASEVEDEVEDETEDQEQETDSESEVEAEEQEDGEAA
jgi:hypothetical protein